MKFSSWCLQSADIALGSLAILAAFLFRESLLNILWHFTPVPESKLRIAGIMFILAIGVISLIVFVQSWIGSSQDIINAKPDRYTGRQ